MNAAAAGRAVDGNRDPADRSSCTLTKSESGPWWMVDLQNEYRIDGVAITSVDDKQTVLDGAEIWIGISERFNDPRNIRWSTIWVFVKCQVDMSFSLSLTPSNRCAVISSFPKKRTLYMPCSGFKGRYITVLLPGDGRALSLCEVEVYPLHFGMTLTRSLISLTQGGLFKKTVLLYADLLKSWCLNRWLMVP